MDSDPWGSLRVEMLRCHGKYREVSMGLDGLLENMLNIAFNIWLIRFWLMIYHVPMSYSGHLMAI